MRNQISRSKDPRISRYVEWTSKKGLNQRYTSVWQKLEEENREFFKAYYLRLTVKHQIIEFNKLLEQQVRLMRQINPTGVVSMPTSNGSHMPPIHQNSACYATEHTGPALKPENMHHPFGSSMTNAFTNGGSALHSSMRTAVDMSAHTTRIDAPQNMLSTQGPNMGLMQGLNGGMIKSESGYPGTSPYMFSADGNVLEARPSIPDASVASFSSAESNSQALNEPLLDADTSSYGFLDQIPQSFSLSDLTAHFAQSSDILENYPRSPFLASDNDNFLDSREREHQGDNKRLDTISEGVSYDDFGSE
ncbi:uncharacterized protein LOC110659377 isoform X2 [Hevea brasiliensis]|uniref:uncharacterized protein LOC110659377 isoform X2 n=1 Tax=Hevea brasiliensis TaxID=3981 RepID=UPI000B78745A|nr:uncharacterized protein LOC110659377 isoform X2 [Hevea brasiliensis]XP_057999954.1 uncharacterized protein LOC110659377 isoform X2 [Hevea brasiliensis]